MKTNAKIQNGFPQRSHCFLEALDAKPRAKIIFNIDKSAYLNDPKSFKN